MFDVFSFDLSVLRSQLIWRRERSMPDNFKNKYKFKLLGQWQKNVWVCMKVYEGLHVALSTDTAHFKKKFNTKIMFFFML